MRTKRTLFYLIDQLLSSANTFLLYALIARASADDLVGAMAVINAIALLCMTGSRAIGIDIWLARGSLTSERQDAVRSSLVFATILLVAIPLIVLLTHQASHTIVIFAFGAVLLVPVDIVRTLLMRNSQSIYSCFLQATIVATLLFLALAGSASSVAVALTFTLGQAALLILGWSALRLESKAPSFKYFKQHRSSALAFLAEVGLGAGLQQILIVGVASIANLTVTGQLRLAQTLIGPMGILHNAASSLFLHNLGSKALTDRNLIRKIGIRFGMLVAILSAAGSALLLLLLNAETKQRGTVLYLLIGDRTPEILAVVLLLGLALSFNGLTLGVGIAGRVLGITARLTRLRSFLIPLQIAVVLAGASSGRVTPVAFGFAISALLTTLVSILGLIWKTDEK